MKNKIFFVNLRNVLIYSKLWMQKKLKKVCNLFAHPLYLCTNKERKEMITQFEKVKFNTDFDHQKRVRETFDGMGYSDFDIKTSLTNGCSHYVDLVVNVLNEGKLPHDAWVVDGKMPVTVRISDHISNLERFGGFEGGSNRCSMTFFHHLRKVGAIQ